MILKSFTLITESLRLRLPNESDVPFIFEASKVPGFTDGLMWDAPVKMEDLIPNVAGAEAAWTEGAAYVFTMIEKESDEFAGRVVIRITKEIDRWNIGFWTVPKFQRKGYMKEALEAIVEFGFLDLEAKTIEADYAIWNKASEKTLLSAGFTFEKTIKDGFVKNGATSDENRMVIHSD